MIGVGGLSGDQGQYRLSPKICHPQQRKGAPALSVSFLSLLLFFTQLCSVSASTPPPIFCIPSVKYEVMLKATRN